MKKRTLKALVLLLLCAVLALGLSVPALADTPDNYSVFFHCQVWPSMRMTYVYGGYAYPLADICGEMGIYGEIESVTVEDETAISVYQEDGEWMFRTLRYFGHEEGTTMTVTATRLDEPVEISVYSYTDSYIYVTHSWEDGVLTTGKSFADFWGGIDSTGHPDPDYSYHAVDQNLTINGPLLIDRDTTLLLCDGCTLDVKGVHVQSGVTLSIYGQRAGTGKIYSHPSSGAGIGGWSGNDNGNIVIHGGVIEATGADHCAGIGSNDGRTGGSITIYGGTIRAKGGSDGAAIGGGLNCSGGNITIYGGNITTSDSPNEDGAGIGGGRYGAGGNITIYGGTINTYSRDGAGIGGGDDGAGGTITIHGGNITSTKVNNGQGARIGGGSDAAPGTIVIDGGNITTVGGDGAGIGGGKGNETGGTVTINGGVINASGSYGIGKGSGGSNVAVTLGYTDATRDTIRIASSSFGGTVTLSQAFQNETAVFQPGTVSDTASLVGTLSAYKQVSGSVTYLDASGSEQTLSEYTQLMPGVTSFGSGWYVVDGIVSAASRMSVNTGCTANIVLLDGAELNVPAGIYVKSGTTLNVFAQSKGESAGRITAGGSQGSGAAAIGSNGSESTGAITINGGVISATGVGGGAGIGGGQSSYAGTITINAGSVTATGSDGAAAIGGGKNVTGGMTGGRKTIAIHGGKVVAYGGKNAAAIGNGKASQFSVTIDGGDVKAIANIFGGVGIGSTSSNLFESDITLNYSGDVKVDASSYHGNVKLSKPFAGENVLLVAVGSVEDLSLLSGAMTPWDGEITTWSDLQRAMNGSYQNSTITLQRDITGGAADSSLQVLSGKKLTLDLNGHTLSHGLTAPSSGGSVIINEGDLTVRDSAGGGVITGGFSSGSGGGIYNSGTLTLQGGAISGNQASGWGGGVYLPDNTGAVMNLTGGVITGNTAAKNGCGIHVSGTAALNASGAPQVYGNHKAGDETALNNINFASGAVMNLTGKLTGGANLGVRLSGGPGAVTTGYGANNGTTYPGAFFTADNADYLISLADGEVQITAPYTVTVNADDAARISVDKTAVGQGDTVTVTVLDDTAINMISVFYMENGAARHVKFTAGAGKTGTFVMPGGNVTVRVNPPVSYWANGKSNTYSGNYTVVTESTTTWTSGWYVVNANVEISQRIEVQGDVKLVLLGTSMDSTCILDAFAGVHVVNPNKLTIYGETEEYGILRAGTTKGKAVPENCAGIGGNTSEDSGPITINSGGVGASGLNNGAGIGGGRNGNGWDITINGGNVAAASIYGAGIGGGMNPDAYGARGQGRYIEINGGKVFVISGKGAGIGGGSQAAGYDITINGGDVAAWSIQGAGIGGGENAIGFQLYINGGNVMARSTTGAGIGFGCNSVARSTKGNARFKDVPGIGGGHIEAYSEQGNALISGAGKDMDVDVTVGFDDPIRVWAGSSKETVKALKKGQDPTEYKYVIIDVCLQDDPTWEITPTTHKQKCDYCYKGFTEEAHTLNNNGVCTVCGFDSNSAYVFFDSDGGTAVEAQLVSLGQKATQPDDPEKDGFTFHGWHKVTDGTMAPETFDFNTAITESVTLKASWTHEHDGLTFLPWDSANSLPTEAGSYYLTRDVTLTNMEGWAWQSGEVNLCLNGHTVTGSGTYQGLINVNGGAVHVFDEAGGAITQTDAGEATVSVWQGGAFTLHGGSIGIDSDILFAVVDAGSFTMTGGEVTGSARGVDVRSGAAFTVSGGARVAGSAETNVQLASGQKIAIGGVLSDSARIGVTMNAGSGVFTTGLNGGSASAFFSDDSSRAVTVGTDGEAHIDDLFTVTVNPGEGSGAAFTVSSDDENNWGEYMAYGKFIHGEGGTTFCTPAGSAFTAPEGKLFLGWKKDGDDTLYDEGYFLPAGTYAITAQWANAHSIAWADMPEGANWVGAESRVQAPAGDVVPVLVQVDEAAHNAGLRITAFTLTGDGIDPITIDKDLTGKSLEPMVMGSTILYATNFPMPDADVTVTPVISRLPSAAAPTFTPEGGFYVMAPSVTLASETAGAVIHYTTDGTTPTLESPVYTGPITITETTTVKAIAVKEDMIASTVAEAEYRYQHREVTLLPGEIDGASVAGETIVISGDDPASWTDMDTMAHGKFFRGLEEDVLFLYPDCPYTAPEGYIFSGWKHAESGSVNGSGKLTGQTVFTLIAQWEPRYTVTKAALPAYAEWGTFTTELMEGDSFRPVVKIDGDAWQIGIRLTAVVVTDSQGHEIATLTQDAYGRDLSGVTATPGSDGMVEISLARCTIGAEDVTVSARFTATFAPAEFNLPAFITEVKESAFEGAAMESVSIPATCTDIGANAFKDCANLTRIRIPAGCSVGANAFDGCAKVFIFGTAGSSAETYCQSHDNCVFVEDGQN